MVTTVVPRPYEKKNSASAYAANNVSTSSTQPAGVTPRTPESFRSLFAKRILREQASRRVTEGLRVPKLNFEKQGLVRTNFMGVTEKTPISVGIIGAGASGLYAALILQDLGIQCKVFEADPTRIGGRLFTYYFDGAKSAPPGSSGYYQYFDIGAMRIPLLNTMERLLVDDFTKSSPYYGSYGCLVKYLNDRVEPEAQLKVIKYVFSSENNLLLYNGEPPMKKGTANPPGFGPPAGPIPVQYHADNGAGTWLDAAYSPITDVMAKDFNKGFDELMKFDLYSTRQYLRSFITDNVRLTDGNGEQVAAFQGRYPEEVIDWLETVDSATGLYNYAFSESVMDSYDFSGSDDKWRTFDGGLSRLADAMASLLKEPPILGHRVSKIAPTADGSKIELVFEGSRELGTFDHVISTATFGALRGVDTRECNLSYNKQLAMRTLHYDNAVKVAITFKTRFWEHPKNRADRIEGGQSSTDLPSRTVVYPSYGIEPWGTPPNKRAPGVLMTSYTWSQDAARMGALTHAQRVEQCLSDLRALHGAEIIDAQYAGLPLTYSFDWYQAPNFCGPYALYGPGQFTKLYPDAIAPEVKGRLHFAGEAMSVHHAWIVGSLNSAYRTVFEILQAEKLSEEMALLKLRWGTIDEVDMGGIAIAPVGPPGVTLPGNDEEGATAKGVAVPGSVEKLAVNGPVALPGNGTGELAAGVVRPRNVEEGRAAGVVFLGEGEKGAGESNPSGKGKRKWEEIKPKQERAKRGTTGTEKVAAAALEPGLALPGKRARKAPKRLGEY